ncbi:MAG: isoprenylcysteine carboxylmethyltransferase family protein [Vicinamibacterales bacterium]
MWKALEFAGLAAGIGSITWGALSFFVDPGRPDGRLRLVAGFAAAGFVNQAVETWRAAAALPSTAVAVGLYLTALWLFWSAVRACASHRPAAIFTAGTPGSLVEGGPYRVLRHPFYASYACFWLAGAIGTGAWTTWLAAIVMTAIYAGAAREEERAFARSPFASRYAAYRRRTGITWPRPASRSALRERGAPASPTTR